MEDNIKMAPRECSMSIFGITGVQQSDYTVINLINLIVFLIGIVGGGVQLAPLGTAAKNSLLCQPRVIMMMEKLVE
jgi:hypothetical protein